MPHNDYNDPEIPFPRLEARIQKVEDDAYWITIWLWEKPGTDGRKLLNRKRAGSYADAQEVIQDCARQYGAIAEPDDIIVD